MLEMIIKGIAEAALKNPRVQNGMIDAAKKVWNFASYKCPNCGRSFTSTQSPGNVISCPHCGMKIRT